MSEVVISRRGGSSSGSGKNMVTEYITESKRWTVPKAKDQKFDVRIFGGGGGCWRGDDGGGGGWMNNDILTIQNGENVMISIGDGVSWNSSDTGGTTSFGSYLSANGGDRISGGSGSGYSGGSHHYCYGYQFGGGYGSSGGVWGGGGYGKGADGGLCGGGYYCPSGGADGTKGGGGFGLWVGGSLIASYGCGGNTTGSEPGICIISYYPVD